MSTKMTPRQRERCERAIATLKALKLPKGARFRMEFWGSHTGNHDPAEHNYCGTSACAAGWLSLDPWFRRHGMRGKWVDGELWPFRVGQGVYQWPLLKDYFGLGEHEAQSVFGRENQGTARQAAHRLQRVLDARDRSAR